jgi:hypothetical protein
MSRLALVAAAAVALAVPACPVVAQRAACGFGLGLEALTTAARGLARGAGASSLSDGRLAAGSAATALETASGRFDGCGCPDLAEAAGEAAAAAQMAALASDFPMLTARLGGSETRLVSMREALGRRGCH